MGEPRSFPAVSATEAEQFFAHGAQAFPAENTKTSHTRSAADHPCCTRVDVPGVGLTHAHDCSAAKPRFTLPAPDGEPGVVPATLQDWLDQEERDGLVSQLIVAAQNLAEINLRKSRLLGSIAGFEIRTAGCVECLRPALAGHQPHNPECNTGRVLGLVAALLAPVAAQVESMNRKEAGPAEEMGRAGDGARMRGLSTQTCLKCGARDGEWSAEAKPDVEVLLSKLALNQLVGAGQDGHGHTLYTHHCASRPRGINALFATGGAQ
jgi:hypothetical protein